MLSDLGDLIMMDATLARRALGDRALQLSVLRPFGTWLGQGALRVLRIRPNNDGSLELITGYERYVREQAL